MNSSFANQMGCCNDRLRPHRLRDHVDDWKQNFCARAILIGTGEDLGAAGMFESDTVNRTATLFRRAVESLDTPAAIALMREDVELFSPVPRAPFSGRDVVGAVFKFLTTVTTDHQFQSMTQCVGEAILCFAGALAGNEFEWIHRLQIDENGEIWRITDMVRPLSAVLALQEAAGGRRPQS